MVLRNMINNFFIENRESTIKGITLSEIIKNDCETVEEYTEKIILNYEEEEKELLVIIASIVLRIEIDILIYDIEFDPPVIFLM